jgi:hypothetical protein
MRVTTTMLVLLLTGVLFASSANAGCELTCEGVCKQEAAMCQLDAALEVKAGKTACINEANDGLMECLGADVETRADCADLCGGDYRSCMKEARDLVKECRLQVRETFIQCREETGGLGGDLRGSCAEVKGACLQDCAGGVPDGGGLS